MSFLEFLKKISMAVGVRGKQKQKKKQQQKRQQNSRTIFSFFP